MKKPPQGYPVGIGEIKIAVKMKRSTFDKLTAQAAKQNVKFSVVVEDTLKCGLLCLAESDAMEKETST